MTLKKTAPAFIAVTLALATLCDFGHAQPEAEASAYVATIIQKGVAETLKKAEEGNVEAQRHIGTLALDYINQGLGAGTAIKWFQLAAAQGDISAMNALARLYVLGRGVPQDLVESAKWFRRANVVAANAELKDGPLTEIVAQLTATAEEVRASCRQVAPEMPPLATQTNQVGVVEAGLFLVDGAAKGVVIFSGPKVFHQAVRKAMLNYDCSRSRASLLVEQKFTFQSEGSATVAPTFKAELFSPRFVGLQPAFNSDWLGLQSSQQAAVRDQHPDLKAGDEPPYPSNGMGELLENIRIMAEHVGVLGRLTLKAKISPTGTVDSVDILASPDPTFSKLAAKAVSTSKFKVGKCAGKPCAMDFPLDLTIARQRNDAKPPGVLGRISVIEAALNGQAFAQNQLGEKYELGLGVIKDPVQAVKWYRLAALQDDAAGQNNLARMYEAGRGIDQDYSEAAKLYRKAANQNFAAAQSNYGFLLANGRGVNQDLIESVAWYQKSADKGNALGQNNLGYAYESGAGVPQDFERAVAYYQKAADKKNVLAQVNLAKAYSLGQGVPKDLSIAATWLRKAAEAGNVGAQTNYGIALARGLGVEQNLVESVVWYRKAAEQGSAAAINNVANSYERGKGVTRDDVEAVIWYRRAADMNFAPSIQSLSVMYAEGRGVAKDPVIAFGLLVNAADLGYELAQFQLGQAYFSGIGVSKDATAALKWFRLAAKGGNAEAAAKIKEYGLDN